MRINPKDGWCCAAFGFAFDDRPRPMRLCITLDLLASSVVSVGLTGSAYPVLTVRYLFLIGHYFLRDGCCEEPCQSRRYRQVSVIDQLSGTAP